MSKLNVTEGEWSVEVCWDGDNYIYANNCLIATVSELPNDAILMSQSKKLYNEIMQDLINLEDDIEYIPKHSGEYEHLKNLIEHKSKLLAQCRGEQPTCKN